jgi:uncharacterized protein (DUF983 family)
MSTLNKVILLIINILGAITIGIGLIMPFLTNQPTSLILAVWMMIAGFLLWYYSTKLIEENN